jgi:hypothetical protein
MLLSTVLSSFIVIDSIILFKEDIILSVEQFGTKVSESNLAKFHVGWHLCLHYLSSYYLFIL